MFTPKNIQGALEELYDLCDPDYMVDMLVNYSEEFDDISPALLAKSFQKNAEMVSEYRVLSSAGEGIDYQGKALLNSRAVRLLSYVEDMSGNEKVRTIQSKELWLAEDMTFYDENKQIITDPVLLEEKRASYRKLQEMGHRMVKHIGNGALSSDYFNILDKKADNSIYDFVEGYVEHIDSFLPTTKEGHKRVLKKY